MFFTKNIKNSELSFIKVASPNYLVPKSKAWKALFVLSNAYYCLFCVVCNNAYCENSCYYKKVQSKRIKKGKTSIEVLPK